MIDTLLTALNLTEIPFVETGWVKAPKGVYGVVALDNSPDSQWADGHMVDQIMEGTIDLFCPSAGRAEAQTIQSTLNAIEGLSWQLYSIQYEDDTKLTHWEWVFQYVEVVSDGENGS